MTYRNRKEDDCGYNLGPHPTGGRTVSQPIPIKVIRYGCPHCGRTASRPVRAREHMARCWHNPAARACKTCKHFKPGIPGEIETGWPGEMEHCAVGVSLEGRLPCPTCHGEGRVFGEELGVSECPECGGDGAEIKPGPVVGCDLWEEPAGSYLLKYGGDEL